LSARALISIYQTRLIGATNVTDILCATYRQRGIQRIRLFSRDGIPRANSERLYGAFDYAYRRIRDEAFAGTTRDVESHSDARVYALRWRIEVFHKILKLARLNSQSFLQRIGSSIY
jgi:hypothetical protein